MNPHQIRMNQPYFQQLPPLMAKVSQPVPPQNPPVILYLPNGNYIIADSAPCDSFAYIQPSFLDATINGLENVIRLEDLNANVEGRKVEKWNVGWKGRWKRKKWYIACIMVTLVVIGAVGGFVGYSLTRNNELNGQMVLNDTKKQNEQNNEEDMTNPPIDNNTIYPSPNNPTNNSSNNTNPNQTNNTHQSNTTHIDTNTNHSNSTYENTNHTSSNTTSQTNSHNSSTPNYYHTTREYICSSTHLYCSNIPESVMRFIFDNFYEYNQINALIQLARSFNLIVGINNASRISQLGKNQFTDIYKNITRSAQCMSHLMPDNLTTTYQTVINLQITTPLHTELYLNLTESSSGLPIKVSFNSSLTQSCLFNMAPTTSNRRLQEGSDTYQSGYGSSNGNCLQNQSQVLLYIHPYGLSPVGIVDDLKMIQSTLGSDSGSSSLVNGVIAMGMWTEELDDGLFKAIIPAFEQLLTQEGSSIPSRNSTLCALKLIVNRCNSGSALPSDYSIETYKKLTQFYTRKVIQSLTYNSSLYQPTRHKQFIRQQLNEGKKVIMVAHSQAAIYANRVYGLLDYTQRLSVALVYVAPASKNMTDGTSNYITNPNDQVISYLRNYALDDYAFPEAFAPNMTPVNFTSESPFNMNHFITGYLYSYREKFINLIASAKSRTVLPNQSWGNGPITVTLLWDNQPDVDLHVFEPGGIHVYYENRRGTNGYLDADDTFMYGPEHYYANCGLQEGNYTIKLNYYSGASPSSVVVTVAAGNEYLIKSMEVYPPMGNVGNSNPPHYVCTVIVKYNYMANSNDFRINQ